MLSLYLEGRLQTNTHGKGFVLWCILHGVWRLQLSGAGQQADCYCFVLGLEVTFDCLFAVQILVA